MLLAEKCETAEEVVRFINTFGVYAKEFFVVETDTKAKVIVLVIKDKYRKQVFQLKDLWELGDRKCRLPTAER